MTIKEILADPSISSWLKDALKMAYEQDPLDALRDAHRLLKMLGERYTQVVNRDLVLVAGQQLPRNPTKFAVSVQPRLARRNSALRAA
jgi:hypothetical protein